MMPLEGPGLMHLAQGAQAWPLETLDALAITLPKGHAHQQPQVLQFYLYKLSANKVCPILPRLWSEWSLVHVGLNSQLKARNDTKLLMYMTMCITSSCHILLQLCLSADNLIIV